MIGKTMIEEGCNALYSECSNNNTIPGAKVSSNNILLKLLVKYIGSKIRNSQGHYNYAPTA